MLKLTTAKIKFKPKQIETKYGLRIQTKATLLSGEEISLWDNPDGLLSAYEPGEVVKILKTEKGGYKVVEDSFVKVEEPKSNELSAETKRQMMAFSQQQIRQFAWTFKQVQAEFEAQEIKISEESIRAISTTIMISCDRKFRS